MAFKYKQKCGICKTNYVTTTRMQHFVVCEACQKRQMAGEIKDPEMKKMFDVPEIFYRENSFLRNIKKYYLKFDKLSEKQIEIFKKVAEDMKNKA